MKAFVSAAFLTNAGKITSIYESKSFGCRFSSNVLIVKMLFLANYDLKESTTLINSLIIAEI